MGAGGYDPPRPWALEESYAKELVTHVGNIDIETLSKGPACALIRAPYDVNVGEQVFLPYGEETNAELLNTHGFTLDDNSAEFLTLFNNFKEMAQAYAAFV